MPVLVVGALVRPSAYLGTVVPVLTLYVKTLVEVKAIHNSVAVDAPELLVVAHLELVGVHTVSCTATQHQCNHLPMVYNGVCFLICTKKKRVSCNKSRQKSPTSTWLLTSRLDTTTRSTFRSRRNERVEPCWCSASSTQPKIHGLDTFHVPRVEPVELVVSSASRRACRAIRASRVEPCCSSSTQPKCMDSTRRTCRIVLCGNVTSKVKFGL